LPAEPQVPQCQLVTDLWVCKYKTEFCHPFSSTWRHPLVFHVHHSWKHSWVCA
jgi:hypothetical protein